MPISTLKITRCAHSRRANRRIGRKFRALMHKQKVWTGDAKRALLPLTRMSKAVVFNYPERRLTKQLGRPAMPYDPQIAEEICARIATSDRGLAAILEEAKADGIELPSISTVLKWLNNNVDFEKMYARSKELQADFMADQIIEISDEANGDACLKYNPDGTPYAVMDGTNVQRSRLMVDSRKWLAAKLRPRTYGDKVDVTSDGKALPAPVAPIAIDARVQTIMMLAAARKGDEEEARRLLED